MKPRTDNWSYLGMFLMAVFTLYLYPLKQRDFLGIYAASSALNTDHDPYDTGSLPPVTGVQITPFTYPPYVLYLFHPFTRLEFVTAARIFLTLKLMCIGGLLYLWHRLFNLNQYH